MLALFKKQKESKLLKAIETGDLNTLSKRLKQIDAELLNQQTDRLSTIEIAIRAGQAKALGMLIDAGANLEHLASTNEPYLLLALQQEHSLPLISVLLQSGADPQQIITVSDTHAVTACFQHCSSTTLMLHLNRFIQYGMDLNQPDSQGLTALEHALKTENKELLNFLIVSGANTPQVWPESTPEALKVYLNRCVDDMRIRQMFLEQ
ncbi:hypothetical protein [Neptunomonas qingdaonensis]|uniref:Uncharacterized protein n=1 Tax=Neptunomonas qingdaonensis TaxID=1045558 RepID=A0A1I2TWZ7_9GAMM|nr:hypothetical protein [Neptunomonas qingdaonensis]SFG69402.1 hypothetical protein SAMN05216175_11168 [Neptunomonas qingdaonensis]